MLILTLCRCSDGSAATAQRSSRASCDRLEHSQASTAPHFPASARGWTFGLRNSIRTPTGEGADSRPRQQCIPQQEPSRDPQQQPDVGEVRSPAPASREADRASLPRPIVSIANRQQLAVRFRCTVTPQCPSDEHVGAPTDVPGLGSLTAGVSCLSPLAGLRRN
jgi:hypothetical protein